VAQLRAAWQVQNGCRFLRLSGAYIYPHRTTATPTVDMEVCSLVLCCWVTRRWLTA
jgi:hypothetical protein